ncbi:MAG TPA: hypothetical protein VKT33_11945 [Candidatus Angelobacter sp.]|nr:hypothetical protein [Candidatus Angelobacter sp.]
MSAPNPVPAGFRTVTRDPALFFMEAAWRWSFGTAALLLLWHAFRMLPSAETIMHAGVAAWNSRNPMLIAATLVRIEEQSGHRISAVALFVFPVITLLWVALSALGRVASLRRFSPEHYQDCWLTIFGLHLLRALFLWIGIFTVIGTAGVEGQLATHNHQLDYIHFYLMALPSLLAIGFMWIAVNWHLFLAPICAGNGISAYQAIRRAVRMSRTLRAELASVSALSGLLRVAGILIVFVVCIATSAWMGPAPRRYSLLVAAVTLLYFAFADFLFAARQASFAMIVTPPAEAEAFPLSASEKSATV